jgi:hypothetical protein
VEAQAGVNAQQVGVLRTKANVVRLRPGRTM